jgi:hypothetical protein
MKSVDFVLVGALIIDLHRAQAMQKLAKAMR